MATSFRQDDDVVTLIAGASGSSGALVQAGVLFGVAMADFTSGEPMALGISGVYAAPKTTGQAWAVGDKLYYASGTGKLTNVADGVKPYVAICTEAAGSSATTGGALLIGRTIPVDGSGEFLKRYTLDATGGLAIGTTALSTDDGALPDNAVLIGTFYEVETTFTSATDAATIALGVPTDSAAGIKAAVAISNGANPWDAGFAAGIQTGSPANFIKLTAARTPIAAVAVEDLTAGKLHLYVRYVVSPF